MAKANVIKFERDARGVLQLDKSYNFVDKHEAVDELRTLIEDDALKLKVVAERSGVTRQTLKRWFDGKTLRPQAPTLNAVGRLFGKRLGWVDIKG